MKKEKLAALLFCVLAMTLASGKLAIAPAVTALVVIMASMSSLPPVVHTLSFILHALAVAGSAAVFRQEHFLVLMPLIPFIAHDEDSLANHKAVSVVSFLLSLASLGFIFFISGDFSLVGVMAAGATLASIVMLMTEDSESADAALLHSENKEMEREIATLKAKLREKKSGGNASNYLSVILGLEFDGFSESENIDRVMSTIDSALHPIFCAYYLADKGMKAFVLDQSLGHCGAFRKREEFGSGFVGETYNTKHFSYISSLQESTTDEYRKEQLNGVNCALAFPVVVGGDVLGAFVIGAGVMNESEEQNLTNICSIISNKVNTEFNKIQEHKEVAEKSITDKLTGLYNRLYFDELFPQLFKQAVDQKMSITYVMIDLDFFKQMNDTHGHDFGDKVLKIASKTFAENIRKSDYAFRQGGDEFCLVLMGADSAAARHVATKIAKEYEKKVEAEHLYAKKDGRDVRSSFSIGIASYPEVPAKEPKELVKSADNAVYYVKQHGKNNMAVAGGK